MACDLKVAIEDLLGGGGWDIKNKQEIQWRKFPKCSPLQFLRQLKTPNSEVSSCNLERMRTISSQVSENVTFERA